MKLAIAFILSATLAHAGDLPTARESVEIAKKRMSPVSQDQVLRVDGLHCDPELHIRQWNITFYDDTRVNNALTVRVEAGQDTETRTALRLLGDASFDHFDRNFTGYAKSEVINLARWKIDSDDALKLVLKQPRISEVQITEVRMTLRRLSEGEVPPVWRVFLRARSKTDARREAAIGYVDLSAESGEVFRNELRVDKLLK